MSDTGNAAETGAPKKPHGERNVGASVFQRLRNRARANGDDIALTLIRYVGERFLYRLSVSAHRDRFVLKGATLFTIWQDKPHRATRDLDFMGSGDSSVDAMRRVVAEIAAIPCASDGVLFLADTLTVEERSEGRVYRGLHVEIGTALATARPRVEIDIAFGEAVTPAPQEEYIPTLLPELPAPTLRVYPRETVVAEKCEAMVNLGIANTRMKDFYDLWYLSRMFAFDGQRLVDAVRATFIRRGTPLPPDGVPFALTDAFASDDAKTKQWRQFLAKSDPGEGSAMQIRTFLTPCLIAAATGATPFEKQWEAGGSWRENTPGSIL
ncbi:MAG: nucleotidyl transferase AbiEii/AbiGii toxin family protein [Fibrella sp.]|nr:nucleotidyl transferase AbiEii/AbiGii toxin family protein [Armatimonadota bacterium]